MIRNEEIDLVNSHNYTIGVWQGFVPPQVELIAWFVLIGRINIVVRLCRLNLM